MGQKSSHFSAKLSKTKLPLIWVLRTENNNPKPEQPIKFQYKTKRKNTNTENQISTDNTKRNSTKTQNAPTNIKNTNALNNLSASKNQCNNLKNTNLNEIRCKIIKTQNAPLRAKSEPSLATEKANGSKHRHRKKSTRVKNGKTGKLQQFGYEIEDVDAFLTKATIEKPANIPVVLAFPSVLYQTRIGGYQAEISLPLGMVVNAVFKNQNWLYVQTPHAEEGYVSYAACLPLGIIPPPDDDLPAPCWERSTDVFPKPSGNMTDTEKLSSRSGCSGRRCRRVRRSAASICSERSFDRLYLRAAASARIGGTRETLLVVGSDFDGDGSEDKNALRVRKGDVVALIGTQVKGWFWVRGKDGTEGFIPAAVAGHGFL